MPTHLRSALPGPSREAWAAGLVPPPSALAVNRELVLLYWEIGHAILERQQAEGWGARVIDRLAANLRRAFPALKGFSPRNLKYMQALAEAYPERDFVQQPVAQSQEQRPGHG